MKTNVAAVHTERTHEGGMARSPEGISQLERQVASCMLFESGFYESGSDIAASIAKQCEAVAPAEIARLAVKARNDFKLRHVPLFLVAQLDKRRGEDVGLVKRTVYEVVQRPDEMGELLSIVQKENGGKPLKKVLSAQVKKGLAAAFTKFNGYQLAKWSRDETIKLKDVLFLVHAKPKGEEQAATWKALVNGTLESAETWELVLSSAKEKGLSKKDAWESVIDMWITEDGDEVSE